MNLGLRRAVDVGTSFAASASRVGTGMAVAGAGKRPAQPLALYDFEACPFCRKAREALSVLDLEAMVYPCPKGGSRFREEVRRRGGKALFPYLVDPNTGQEMYESDDIVRYLFETYGDGSVPWLLSLGPVTLAGSAMASAWRFGRGERYRRARAPERPLELWSFEASPFSRLVREELCSLEIPYLLHNVARGSARRDAFVARSGKMMVPYLVDPNTGTSMFESADIVRYLDTTYAL
jgi:glutathione S-transferase